MGNVTGIMPKATKLLSINVLINVLLVQRNALLTHYFKTMTILFERDEEGGEGGGVINFSATE